MRKEFITNSSRQTQKLGKMLAEEIKPGAIVCLEGDLGSGKTTFTQGLLKGLGAKGPYTSPTFVIMKKYSPKTQNPKPKTQKEKSLWVTSCGLRDIYHIDAYRVKAKDILNLGWKEMVAEKNNIIIIEWADRIKKIIPRGAIWVKLEWLDENRRKISFK